VTAAATAVEEGMAPSTRGLAAAPGSVGIRVGLEPLVPRHPDERFDPGGVLHDARMMHQVDIHAELAAPVVAERALQAVRVVPPREDAGLDRLDQRDAVSAHERTRQVEHGGGVQRRGLRHRRWMARVSW
jgi:hypothetical protein